MAWQCDDCIATLPPSKQVLAGPTCLLSETRSCPVQLTGCGWGGCTTRATRLALHAIMRCISGFAGRCSLQPSRHPPWTALHYSYRHRCLGPPLLLVHLAPLHFRALPSAGEHLHRNSALQQTTLSAPPSPELEGRVLHCQFSNKPSRRRGADAQGKTTQR